ncbi:EthD domain-containing protein [Clohesyomyces aquaticus]|uniref:EthD domain-containing protein n=1 Tax=Clohesyomyces aquaticus TaxID=1231657 RepID=A0A1Y2A7T2_9PLEO|nr:EthD domain-containing protein [Clohesyomyces aquaticus]
MPYTIVLFVSRKPGLSTAQFKDHYENVHMAILKSVAGSTFPVSHTRKYVARVDSGAGIRAGVSPGPGATSSTPVVLVGDVKEVDWDAYAELTFRDALHFQQFFAVVNEPEAAEKIQEDEVKFSDADKFKVVVLGETTSTRA